MGVLHGRAERARGREWRCPSPCGGNAFHWASDQRVEPAGATDGEHILLLAVEVQQDFATQPARSEALGAGQAGLFVRGEQNLERTVVDVSCLKHSHSCGNANSVVSTQRGSVGVYNVPDAHQAERSGHEVVRCHLICEKKLQVSFAQLEGRVWPSPG